MNDRDPQFQGDALGRRAAAALRDDVDRRVDVDEALRRTLAGGAGITPLHVSTKAPGANALGTRGRAVWFGAAAAVAVVGIGAALFALTDDDPRVVPADVAPTLTLDDTTTVASTPGTTVPSSDSPAAAPDTTVAPTAAPSTVANSVPPPSTDVDALAGLVAPPPIDPIEVPAFLPPTPVADPSQVRLTLYDLGTDAVAELVQTWMTESGRVVQASTLLERGAPPLPGETAPVDAPPWDDAVVVTTLPDGLAQVRLTDPSGTVTLGGIGYTADELVSIFTRMSLTSEGWRLPDRDESGLVELHSGWRRAEFATRKVRWDTGSVQGELIVTLGAPDSIRTGYSGMGTPSTIEDLRGAPALVSETDSATVISWSPAPDVVVVLGFTGSVDEALSLARSLDPVDGSTWQAAGVIDTVGADGCDSYFFC